MIGIKYYFRKATIDDFDFIFDLKKKISRNILKNILNGTNKKEKKCIIIL